MEASSGSNKMLTTAKKLKHWSDEACNAVLRNWSDEALNASSHRFCCPALHISILLLCEKPIGTVNVLHNQWISSLLI